MFHTYVTLNCKNEKSKRYYSLKNGFLPYFQRSNIVSDVSILISCLTIFSAVIFNPIMVYSFTKHELIKKA